MVVAELLTLLFFIVIIGVPVLIWTGVVFMGMGVHALIRPEGFSGGRLFGATILAVGVAMFTFNAGPTLRFFTGHSPSQFADNLKNYIER